MQHGAGRTLTYINSSGEYPYRLLINLEDHILRVKISGQWPYRDPAMFWNRIAGECRSNAIDRVLVMFQLTQPVDIRKTYALASEASELVERESIRMAVVDVSQRSFVNPKLWHSATTSGEAMMLFDDIESARSWLDV